MKNNNMFDITIQTKDLAHALGFSGSIVEKRNIIQELSNIKLFVSGQDLEISATDMDLYLKQKIGAKVVFEGETTVSTQILLDVVRKITDPEIKLKQSIDGKKLEVIGVNCKFELLTLPTLRFPVMEDIESNNSLLISCNELAKMIEYTSFAMSNEETRYNLNGIYLNIKEKEFSAVATDAHRLSLSSIAMSKNHVEFGVIVPRKSITELLKIIKDPQYLRSDIKIFLSQTKIKFICHDLVMISKLIDGVFPDYIPFIPSDTKNKLVINTKLLKSTIDRVATITVDKFRAIKIFINSDEINITASGEAKGDAREIIRYSDEKKNFCSFFGEDITIGFNPKYIIDILNAVTEEQIEIYLKDSFSPVLIKTENSENYIFVVMPVKV